MKQSQAYIETYLNILSANISLHTNHWIEVLWCFFLKKSMTCDFSLLTAELQELQIFWPVFGQLFLNLWELIGYQWQWSTSVGKRIFQNKKVDTEKGWPKTCDICIETTQGMEIFRISAPINESSVFSCTAKNSLLNVKKIMIIGKWYWDTH